MNDLASLQNTLLVGAILFVLGMIGFVTRRNLIVMFLCAEMMLQGVSVSLVGWGNYRNDWGGQMLVVFIIAVAACEAGIALALVLLLAQRSGKLDAVYWQDLRESGVPAHIDQNVPEEREDEQIWPRLTPAGIEPQHDPEEEAHRSRV
jgi:NADH-quinone oxidoreductase subunit K